MCLEIGFMKICFAVKGATFWFGNTGYWYAYNSPEMWCVYLSILALIQIGDLTYLYLREYYNKRKLEELK